MSLEEDAARKMGEEEGNVICYRIDRLGIPLIEVTTAPVIKSPKETGEVALAIGSILRATGKVKRGLGTIRQDLNISIPNGALVEIKGVQELELVPLAVEYEVQRQLNLLKIKEELEKRKVREEEVTAQFHDVTHVFKQTESKIIRKALETGKSVFALVLPKFKGLLKWELLSNLRLGTEMADRAKFWGQVGGIFHTDEMPAYGISTEEVERMKSAIKVGESDAAVFVVDCEEKAKNALRAVAERAREALRGVPDETRAANVDGTSRYMRPRPGPARMYPETDIPLMQVTSERLESLASKLPEPPEQRLKHLMKEHRLNEKLARQIMESEYGELFETVTGKSHVPSTTVAAFLTETLKSLKRTGVRVESVSESQIEEIFQALDSGEIAKESLPEIAKWLSEHEKKSVMEAVTDTGLKMMSREELEKIIDEALRTDELLVEARGINALGPLMNTIMKKVRGKAIADVVNRLLRERLEAQGGRKREKK